MSLLHLAGILAAAFASHAPPTADMAAMPALAAAEQGQAPLQDARIYLAALHVGRRGPGHMARTHPAAVGGGSCTAGQLDFSCATNSALTAVVF